MLSSKLIIAGGLVVVLAGAGWYVKNLIETNAILEQNALIDKQALESKEKALAAIQADSKKKDRLVKERDLTRAANIEVIRKLRAELKNDLTPQEIECYTAPVPDAVVDSFK